MEKKYQNEIWIDIPDYNGVYQISDYGRVKTLHHRFIKPRILKAPLRKGKYPFVVLTKEDGKKPINVHRLVLIAFKGLQTGMVCNHINGNKHDCRLQNLEWVTPQQNREHARKTGLMRGRSIQVINPLTKEIIREYRSIQDACKDGYSRNPIYLAITGKQAIYKGYKWKYKHRHNNKFDYETLYINSK